MPKPTRKTDAKGDTIDITWRKDGTVGYVQLMVRIPPGSPIAVGKDGKPRPWPEVLHNLFLYKAGVMRGEMDRAAGKRRKRT